MRLTLTILSVLILAGCGSPRVDHEVETTAQAAQVDNSIATTEQSVDSITPGDEVEDPAPQCIEKDRSMSKVEAEEDVQEAMLCIPGPWKDRTEFLQRVVTHTKGEFMFAGGILANSKAKVHVPLEFCGHDDSMRQAFEIAGQGKLQNDLLDLIDSHKSVVFIRFPLDVIGQKERMLMYTSLLRDVGGYAVKVESAGTAHTWEVWEELITSESPFDQYRGFVVLIADDTQFYSCGMHHFGLPDCQISRDIPMVEAADAMNRFNCYQIFEHPELASGHTFSLAPDAPYYRLTKVPDQRHEADDLFHNPNGLWTLGAVLK